MNQNDCTAIRLYRNIISISVITTTNIKMIKSILDIEINRFHIAFALKQGLIKLQVWEIVVQHLFSSRQERVWSSGGPCIGSIRRSKRTLIEHASQEPPYRLGPHACANFFVRYRDVVDFTDVREEYTEYFARKAFEISM